MKKSTSFFSIGIFVLIGLVFLVVIIIALGSGRWFQRPIYADTFFHESVQGLNVGSPVKFRGVKIGEVSEITFTTMDGSLEANHLKDPFSRAVYVKMSLDPKDLPPATDVKVLLRNAVHDGLRIRLTPVGFTGTSYLELDFYPQAVAVIPKNWGYDDYYIPSIPSTFKEITEQVEELANTFKKANIAQISEKTLDLLTGLDALTWRLNHLLSANQQAIKDITQNIAASADNSAMITQKYPSQLIFSSAPPAVESKE